MSWAIAVIVGGAALIATWRPKARIGELTGADLLGAHLERQEEVGPWL